MRLVNLNKENKNRYKVVLSRKDWKKILLEINSYVANTMVLIVIIMFIIVFLGVLVFSALYVVLHEVKVLYSMIYSFFVSLKWVIYGLMLLFIGFLFRSYYKSFTMVLRPFYFRGMVIDVVGKKIFLKNKTFSFKDTDTLAFYLERDMEKEQKTPKNNKNNDEKEKKSRSWVYYVKKKAFQEPTSGELGEKGFLANNLEGFIIRPMEIKYLEDFSLVLGKEGLLGVWRQIAELMSINFEENIEFEEEILLRSNGGTTFSYKTSNKFSTDKESSSLFDEDREDEKKMRDFLNLLREKVEKKDTLGGTTSWGSDDFEEYLLFKDELMGVRFVSTGFELRFWSGSSEFPGKEPVINTRFVFSKLIIVIGVLFAIIGFFVVTFFVLPVKDLVLNIIFYLISLLSLIYLVASDLRNSIENARSKEALFQIAYLLENSSIFLAGVISIILGLYGSTSASDFKMAIIYFLPLILGVLMFFGVLSGLHSFSCPWNLTINRYMSKLVFSFEDKVLEGEYGFCVSRTHWQAPVSKIQSLGLLEIGRSLFGSGDFLLAIKIDEDYVVLPLPKLEEDKIREILHFLHQAFKALLFS